MAHLVNTAGSSIRVSLILAVVQLSAFSIVGLLSHMSSMQKSTAPYREFFGCINLQRNTASDPDCNSSSYPCDGDFLSAGVACKNGTSVNTVILLDLPIMLSALSAAHAAYQIGLSQVWVFYAVNIAGISALWWFIGRGLTIIIL
jgi:hypothetical protein